MCSVLFHLVLGVVLQHRGDPLGAQGLPLHGGGAAPPRPPRASRDGTVLPALCESNRLPYFTNTSRSHLVI